MSEPERAAAHRPGKDAGARRSRNMTWVIVWVGLGLALGLLVAATQGRGAATEYFAAYLLEESLSVDNIFVFVVIFSELHIPAEYQRRVLLFGVGGALVFRALAIGAGLTLIERFQWITYPFATLILFAAWRLLFGGERQRKVVKEACDVCGTWIARVVPVSPVLRGHDFWRRESGRLVATPLLVANDRHRVCARFHSCGVGRDSESVHRLQLERHGDAWTPLALFRPV